MKHSYKYLQMGALLWTGIFSTSAAAKPTQKSNVAPRVVKTVTPELLRGKIAYVTENKNKNQIRIQLISPDGKTRVGLPSYFNFRPQHNSYNYNNRLFVGAVLPDGKSYFKSEIAPPASRENSFQPRFMRVYSLSGRSKREISRWQGFTVGGEQLSPDGKFLAYTRASIRPRFPVFDQRIGIAQTNGKGDKVLEGWPPEKQESIQTPANFVAWSRDSKQLLCRTMTILFEGFLEDRELLVTDINGSFVEKYDGDWSRFALPEVSPDGKQRIVLKKSYADGGQDEVSGLFLENRNGDVRTLQTGQISNAQWSLDGKWISFQMSGASLCVIQTDGRNFRVLLRDLPMIDHFWMPS